MARTIRRLPIGYRPTVKWYRARVDPTLRRTGRTIFPIYEQRNDAPEGRRKPYWVVVGILGYRIETEAEVKAMLDHYILLYCRKNGTCHRQRQNAVRKDKQMIRQQERAQGRAELRRLVREAMTDR